MMHLAWLVSIIVGAIIISQTIPSGEAASIYKDNGVGISIEKSLLKSGKLSYHDIIAFDNSTRKYSGDFKDIKGEYRRDVIPQRDNISPYTNGKKFYVLVDPPSSIQVRFPYITIVSNLDAYHTQEQMKVSELKIGDAKPVKSVILTSHSRWVDDRCREAKISYQNWQVLLPDTITYLKSGCTITKIDTISETYQPITKHDIKTSYKYKDQNWRDHIKENCTKSRNACTTLSQPTRGGL